MTLFVAVVLLTLGQPGSPVGKKNLVAQATCVHVAKVCILTAHADFFILWYLLLNSFTFVCYSWHGSAVLTDTKFLIHGGYNGNNALSDAFVFDIG